MWPTSFMENNVKQNIITKTVFGFTLAFGLLAQSHAGLGPDIFFKVLLHPVPLGDATLKPGDKPMDPRKFENDTRNTNDKSADDKGKIERKQ
jgi:hypothetical protein